MHFNSAPFSTLEEVHEKKKEKKKKEDQKLWKFCKKPS